MKKRTISDEAQKTIDELETLRKDIQAFLTGGIGPTQQEYIDKIQSNWNAYNFIVVFGHVYRLTNEKKYRPDGADVLRCPCEVCDLKEYCAGADSGKSLCKMLDADTDEYFHDEGELVIDKRGKMKVEKWGF